jgi:hypothetical protein
MSSFVVVVVRRHSQVLLYRLWLLGKMIEEQEERYCQGQGQCLEHHAFPKLSMVI